MLACVRGWVFLRLCVIYTHVLRVRVLRFTGILHLFIFVWGGCILADTLQCWAVQALVEAMMYTALTKLPLWMH